MKISRGSMVYKVMILLKMVLREFRFGEGVVGGVKVWMFLFSLVVEDIFWDWFRRFVKYCGECREEC